MDDPHHDQDDGLQADEEIDAQTELRAAVTSFTLHALRSRGMASTARRAVEIVTTALSARGGFLVRVAGAGPGTVLFAMGDAGPAEGDSIQIAPEALTTPVRQGPLTVPVGPGPRRPVALSALVSVEDVPWGRLVVWDRPGRRFDAADSHLLLMISAILGAAVERDRLEDAQAAIGALGFLVRRSSDLDTTVAAAVRAVAQVTEADQGAVIRVFPRTGTAVVVHVSSPLGADVGREYDIGGPLAEDLLHDEPLVVEDTGAASAMACPLPPSHGSRACLSTPVVVDGRTWGRLVASARSPRRFTAHERESAWTVANLLSAALQRRRRWAGGEGTPQRGTDEIRRAARETEVALLDRDGEIVWVNEAWDAFCLANGGDPARAGVGMSYLALCDEAGDAPSRDVAAAIRAAVDGDLPGPLRVSIPCHSPQQERWYDILVSSRLDEIGRCVGASLTLSLAD